MVFILKTQSVGKSLLEMFKFNLTTDFVGVLKMHSGELKTRYLPNAPIHIVCYIRKFFDCLEISKYVFIWNMIYIRVQLSVSKTISSQISINLLDCSRFHIGFIWYNNMVLILRNQRLEKILLLISRFSLLTDFGGVLKMHFRELKMRFLQTAPIHIVWFIRKFLTV
jgi:hypothetical protein